MCKKKKRKSQKCAKGGDTLAMCLESHCCGNVEGSLVLKVVGFISPSISEAVVLFFSQTLHLFTHGGLTCPGMGDLALTCITCPCLKQNGDKILMSPSSTSDKIMKMLAVQ